MKTRLNEHEQERKILVGGGGGEVVGELVCKRPADCCQLRGSHTASSLGGTLGDGC